MQGRAFLFRSLSLAALQVGKEEPNASVPGSGRRNAGGTKASETDTSRAMGVLLTSTSATASCAALPVPRRAKSHGDEFDVR